jgi:hypothetical protein
MAHTACRVCLISTVSGYCKKNGKCLGRCGTSRGHTTKLKQSIFFRFLWFQNIRIHLHWRSLVKCQLQKNYSKSNCACIGSLAKTTKIGSFKYKTNLSQINFIEIYFLELSRFNPPISTHSEWPAIVLFRQSTGVEGKRRPGSNFTKHF